MPRIPNPRCPECPRKSSCHELTYAARFSVDRRQMQVEGKMVNLSPGMAIRIKVGFLAIIS
jgi:hemolysin D